MTSKDPITVGDLFCGIGGWSTGLKGYNGHDSGPFKVVWGIDVWDKATTVHKLNHPEVELYTKDIRDSDPRDFERVDVIVGSPPCPAFSSAKQWQDKDIEKGMALVNKFFEFVRVMQPKAFVMENVRTFTRFIEHIKYLPDDAIDFTMKGEEFRLPQRRRRCILTNIIEPKKTIEQTVTLRDMIDTLGLPGEEPPSLVQNPIFDPPMVNGKDADRHDLYEVKEEHILKLFRKKLMMKNAGTVPFPDPLGRPARTICAKPSPVGREPVVIVDKRFDEPKLRYLSLREQAIIQGFPVDYKLGEFGKSDTQIMIGNAFPPVMVKALAFNLWKKARGY